MKHTNSHVLKRTANHKLFGSNSHAGASWLPAILICAVGFTSVPRNVDASNETHYCDGISPDCSAFPSTFDCAQTLLTEGRFNLENFRDVGGLELGALVAEYASTDRDKLKSAFCLYIDEMGASDNQELAEAGFIESLRWLLKGQALLGNDYLVSGFSMRYDYGGGPLPSLEDEIDEFLSAVSEYHVGTNYFEVILDRPSAMTAESVKELRRLLFRKVIARSEAATRWFQLGADSPTPKAKALMELRRGVQESYLGAVVLAAKGAEAGIGGLGLNQLRSHTLNSLSSFRAIVAGLNVGGYHRDYIPFLPFADCNDEGRSLIHLATREVSTDEMQNGALYWENEAKDAGRTVDQLETQLRTAIENIRVRVKDELDRMSNYRTEEFFPGGVGLDDEATIAAFAETAWNEAGSLGQARIAYEEAKAAFDTAFTTLQNIPKKIEIEQERAGQVAQVVFASGEEMAANHVTMGYANAFSFSNGISVGSTGVSGSASISFSPGSIVSGYLNAENEMIRTMQQVRVTQIDSAATVKMYLLELAEAGAALRRHELAVNQSAMFLESMSNRLLVLVDEYGRSLEALVHDYFSDPGYRLEMADAVREAHISLRKAAVTSMMAARALGYDWASEFSGVVLGSTPCFEPFYLDLESPDSVLSLHTASDVNKFLEALNCWRTHMFSDCPPQNHATSSELSLREDILGLSDQNPVTGEEYPSDVKKENVRLFKQFVHDHTFGSRINIPFATQITDEILFPIYIADGLNYHNAKITDIALQISGTGLIIGELNSPTITLGIGGTSMVRQCGSDWRPGDPELGIPRDVSGDLYRIYDLEDMDPGGGFRTIPLEPAIMNPPEARHYDDRLGRISIANTGWEISINTGSPQNLGLDFDKLDDIKLFINWEYGQPTPVGCMP